MASMHSRHNLPSPSKEMPISNVRAQLVHLGLPTKSPFFLAPKGLSFIHMVMPKWAMTSTRLLGSNAMVVSLYG